MTLQKYLQENYKEARNQWSLNVHTDHGDRVHIYLHPAGMSGETIDFTVVGNRLIPHQNDPKKVKAIADAILLLMEISNVCGE